MMGVVNGRPVAGKRGIVSGTMDFSFAALGLNRRP
jgi:hypothetical protein